MRSQRHITSLANLAANRFINFQAIAAELDEAFFSSVRYARAFKFGELSQGNFLTSFSQNTLIKAFPPGVITNLLYPSFLQRREAIQSIAKELPSSVLEVNFVLDNEDNINVRQSLHQWLTSYLEQNSDYLNDEDLSVSLGELFMLAFRLGDLSHCQFIWDHTLAETRASKIPFSTLAAQFLEHCGNGRLDCCKWLWSVGDKANKTDLLVDKENPLGHRRIYQSFKSVMPTAQCESVQWLIACYRELGYLEISLRHNAPNVAIFDSAKPEVRCMLWNSAEDELKNIIERKLTDNHRPINPISIWLNEGNDEKIN